MKAGLRLLSAAAATLSMSACDMGESVRENPSPVVAAAPAEGRIVRVSIPGPSLEGNAAGEPSAKDAVVYLPPGYGSDPERRYPLLILLHGYGSAPGQWEDSFFSLSATMTDALAAGDAQEMIIVMPDGANRLGGGFFTNGTASGDWLDYIAEDVVAFAEREFRVIEKRESRGVAGHSMGGYGALRIAMERTDVFSAVYAMSPCCGDLIEDFTLGGPQWEGALAIRTLSDFQRSEDFFGRVLIALSAAWSPNVAVPPFLADLPVRSLPDGSMETVPASAEKWHANTTLGLIDRHADNLRRLNAIAIDVGTEDDFSHIRVSTPAVSEKLTAIGIEHVFEAYPGDHINGVARRIRTRALPFFRDALSASQE